MIETITYLIKAPKLILIADPIFYNIENQYLENRFGFHYKNEDNYKYCILRIGKANDKNCFCNISISLPRNLADEYNIKTLDSAYYYESKTLNEESTKFEVIINNKSECFVSPGTNYGGRFSIYGDYYLKTKNNDLTLNLFPMNDKLDFDNFNNKIQNLFSCTDEDKLNNEQFENNTQNYLKFLLKTKQRY